jgi:formylglycine-generating enzyme required for sulfatase activity
VKPKLHSLLIVLALFAGIHSALAQVTNLGIFPAGGQSIIYWPASTTNYVLQTVTNLSSTNWVTARTAFAINAMVVTNAAPSGFFRLVPTTTPAGMALIPAGWFTIGNSIGDPDITNANPTNVYVSAFYMDVNLVNYGLWTNVYAYATSQGYNFVNAGTNGGTGTNYPVEKVDWFDCVKWSNARSQQAGLTPCYYTDAGFNQVFTNGDNGTTVYANWTARGYRLPTEAEWEKAARGGGIGLRFPWGNLIQTNHAQYSACTFCGNDYDLGPTVEHAGASPVGSFDANGYGLRDMAGNVYEWCWDGYGGSTATGSPYLGGANPTGTEFVSGRILRGGSWSGQAGWARCAFRNTWFPNGTCFPFSANDGFGFRCARGL